MSPGISRQQYCGKAMVGGSIQADLQRRRRIAALAGDVSLDAPHSGVVAVKLQARICKK